MGLSRARPCPATRERDSHGTRGTGLRVPAICVAPIADEQHLLTGGLPALQAQSPPLL